MRAENAILTSSENGSTFELISFTKDLSADEKVELFWTHFIAQRLVDVPWDRIANVSGGVLLFSAVSPQKQETYPPQPNPFYGRPAPWFENLGSFFACMLFLARLIPDNVGGALGP